MIEFNTLQASLSIAQLIQPASEKPGSAGYEVADVKSALDNSVNRVKHVFSLVTSP